MSVMATAEFSIKPERLEEYLGIMKTALVDTRAFDGCEGLDTYVNQDVAGQVLLVEQWETRSKHEAYVAWRVEGGMMEMLADFVTAAPKFAYFDLQPGV